MTAAPRMVVPAGVTLRDAEAQLQTWVGVCEKIREEREKAEKANASPAELWQASKFGRAAAKETKYWHEVTMALGGKLR